MSEEWRPAHEWHGLYEVSSLGNVRSVPREVAGGNGSRALRGGRTLRQSVDKGYKLVSLSNGRNRCAKRVHVMVLEAFVGPRPYGMHGCHIDGDASNNRAENLYWGTPKQNSADRVKHGTDRFALKRGHCKNGHRWSEANTYLNTNGSPTCRTCRREGMRRKKETT